MTKGYKKRDHSKHGPLMTIEHFSEMVDKEIEDEKIDSAMDSLWLDLLGIYLDCKMLKENLFVRQCFAPREGGDRDDHPSWFEDVGDAPSPHGSRKKGANPYDPTDEQEYWNQIKRNMTDFQAPLTLSTRLCQRIRDLPEKRVTLYIRLDEQVPRNSCTAYQVDWNTFHAKPKKKHYRNKDVNNLFTIFRLCSRPKELNRTECIVGTFASACLYPYTVVPQLTQGWDGEHPTTLNHAPFRPCRLLLDRPEDVCTAELQFYLTRMGLAECCEVSPKLRRLHDAAELDFFPSDQGDFFTVPSVATVLENNNNHRSFSSANYHNWTTSLPFVCLDESFSQYDE